MSNEYLVKKLTPEDKERYPDLHEGRHFVEIRGNHLTEQGKVRAHWLLMDIEIELTYHDDLFESTQIEKAKLIKA